MARLNIEKILDLANKIEYAGEDEVCIDHDVFTSRGLNMFPITNTGIRTVDTPDGTKHPGKLGFNMSVWGPTVAVVDRSGHRCGTAACIGGWTNALYGEENAAAQLGLNYKQERQLFHMENSMDTLHNSNATPRRAAAVLRHFAKTGEVAWDKFDKNGKPAK